eukprot:1158654-Pelagomonas_calceolata.AAC.2
MTTTWTQPVHVMVSPLYAEQNVNWVSALAVVSGLNLCALYNSSSTTVLVSELAPRPPLILPLPWVYLQVRPSVHCAQRVAACVEERGVQHAQDAGGDDAQAHGAGVQREKRGREGGIRKTRL